MSALSADSSRDGPGGRGDRKKRIFAIIGASSGNLVEWFDFYVYAFFAIYFSASFFPKADPTVQLMSSAGVFAAGFLMRPIGGWLFGRIADKQGRRRAMMISIWMMCGGSLAIACLPTYAQIGAAAPLLLLVARLVQGLSVGGEYGTNATYMSEVAIRGERGFFASFQYVTLIGGQLLASLVGVILLRLMDEAELRAWGWRIPFFIGALAAVVSLMMRRSLDETTTSATRQHKDAGTLRGLLEHKGVFITVIGYTAGGSLIFYTFTTYMQKYLVNTAHMSSANVGFVMSGALFIYMLMQPLFGALSDRIGRRTSMIAFGVLATLCTVPLMTALRDVNSPWAAFGLIVVALAIVSLYTSIGGLIKAEVFPPQVRALGVGLSYAIANAMFGGSAEYVALWLKSANMETSFYWYVTAMTAVGLLFSWRIPKPGKGYLEDTP